MTVRYIDCRDLARRTTALGATLPTELQTLLDAHDAINTWAPKTSNALADAIRGGQFTADTANKYLGDELTRPATDPAEVRVKAQSLIVHTFAAKVRAGAGDKIVDAIRPTFDAAKAGVVEASAWITPDTTAEQVIEAGDNAVAAWNALAKHRRTLDQIHELTAFFTDHPFGVATRRPFMRHGGAPHAAFYLRDEAINLDSAAEAMTPEKNTGRGGRWMRLLAVTDLMLNTPTRAAQIIDAQQAEYQRLMQEQYDATHS